MARLLPTLWVCMALADIRNNQNSPRLFLSGEVRVSGAVSSISEAICN